MRAYSTYLLLGLLFAVAAGCTKNDPIDVVIGGKDCTSDTECTDPKQTICNTGVSDTCVQCIPATRVDTCVGTTPVCANDYMCKACTSHADCASDACLPDGSCATESAVVYLTAGGATSGINSCSKSSPCGSMGYALFNASAARPYIRVTGTIENANGDIDGNRTRTFLGSPGATLRGDQAGGGAADQPILKVRNGSKVEVYDLVFKDARRQGVRTEDSGTTLALHRSQVVNAGQEGVAIAGGTMTLDRSEVSSSGDATRYGITFQDGELIVDRSRISENDGGGITVASGKKISVTNSFIVGNKVGGGIAALNPSADSKFDFNTIVDNVGGATALDAGGIICNNPVTSARNNIIFRNTGGTGGMAQRLGACLFAGSFEMAASAADDTLKFKSEGTSPKDYHLTANSPVSVKDVAGAVCTGLLDYDGESRPQGNACDLGADELKQ